MINLEDLEKKINSELTTRIKESKIKHNQLYVTINSEDLLDVILMLKTNKNIKFKQLIELKQTTKSTTIKSSIIIKPIELTITNVRLKLK